MVEILKALRDFVIRDLIYLFSGATLIGACLYLFKRVPSAGDSWVLFTLLGSIGFMLAYGIQDALCIIGVLPTKPVSSPSCFVRWMYEKYYREEWVDVEIKVTEQDEVRDKIPPERLPELERLIAFQQIGTAGGPCIFISGFFFIVAWSSNCDPFDLLIAVGGWILGMILISLAWLKAAQRAKFIAINVKN